MPKVEIEEADLLAQQKIFDAVKKMAANPQARELLNKAQKIVDPTIVTATDYQDELRKEIAERDKKFTELEKKFEDDKAAREADAKKQAFVSEWEAQKKAVRDRYPDLNDEGMAAIQKLAEEKAIPNFEAAAALFRTLNPPATPAASDGPVHWNMFDAQQQDGMKDYVDKLMKAGGEDAAAESAMVRDTLNEIRGLKRAA